MPVPHYLSSQEKIYQTIKARKKREMVKIKNIDFILLPGVFPSQEFRAADYLPDSLTKIVKGKRVLDMGCGFGMVGIYSLKYKAKVVVQADINQVAIKNAKLNKILHGYKEKLQIYKSNCFSQIPLQKFDLIIFNPPFFSLKNEARDLLEKSLLDTNFRTMKKFLDQAPRYMGKSSKIIIVSSSRMDTKMLQKLFEEAGFKWKIWKIFNQDQKYDNRLYMLQLIIS